MIGNAGQEGGNLKKKQGRMRGQKRRGCRKRYEMQKMEGSMAMAEI